MYNGKDIQVGDRVIRKAGHLFEGKAGTVIGVESRARDYNHLAIQFDDTHLQSKDLERMYRWHSHLVNREIPDNIPEKW